MAGKPLRRAFLTALEQNAKDAGLTEAEFVYDYIAGGKTLSDMAELFGVSRSYLSRNLNKIPEIKDTLERARLEAADTFAEQTIKMADDLAAKFDSGQDVKNERVAILREQTSNRKWWAAMANPERYGKSDINVNINLGDLHLDALRKTRSNVIDITPAGAADDE